MDLRELGYFVAVFEEGGITAAARRTHISQPSVSAALAALEAELGSALFVRHPRGVTPTETATRLYPTARRLIAETTALRDSLRTPAAPPEEIVIGVTRSLDALRLRELLAAIATRELRLRIVDAEQRADLRVVSRGQLREGETFRQLWKERFVVALPATHPLALRDTLRSTDLLAEPFIERCHCEHARAFARRARGITPVAIAASEEWALALVAAGIGIAIVPAGVVHDNPHVALRPLADVGLERQLGLALPARASPVLLALVARARARFRAAGTARPPRRGSAPP